MKKMDQVLSVLAVGAVAAASVMIPACVYAGASLYGDANNNGTVEIADVALLNRYLADTAELEPVGALNADVDGDGSVTSLDISRILSYLSGKIPYSELYIGSETESSSEEPTETETETESTEPSSEEQPTTEIVNPDADCLVTEIEFSENGVSLKNAAGNAVALSQAQNVSVENNTYVTITQPGEYDVLGSCSNGQLNVNCDKTVYADGQVTVNLRGLTLSNENDSPIYVASVGDEFVLTIKKDTDNVISDGTNYTNADEDCGAIYCCDDMKIKGKGNLTINGNCKDGLVCKDDLKIWNGNITVNAVDDGIRGKDSVRIGDPDVETEADYDSLNVTVKSTGGDGIRSTADSEGKGLVRINGGSVSVNAYGDGISAQQTIEINGGTIDIYTYEGSNFTGSGSSSSTTNPWGGGFGGGGMGMDGNSNKTENSAKGLKAAGLSDDSDNYLSGGDITINGGVITIDSSDDAVHCAGTLNVYAGKLNLKTADDGLHSDNTLNIGKAADGDYSSVEIVISKCYEGVEAYEINQNNGTVYVVSGDDGYNAAGGADNSGSSSQNPWGQGGGFGGGSSSSGIMNLNGGIVVVNSASGDHDAFDSNGDIKINGGYYLCNGQEPLDCGDNGNSITNNGGNVIKMTAGNTNISQRYTFTDASGKILASFIGGSGTVSSVDLKTASTVYTGGTVSGGTLLSTLSTYEIYVDGTLSNGTATTGSGGGNSWGQNPWG